MHKRNRQRFFDLQILKHLLNLLEGTGYSLYITTDTEYASTGLISKQRVRLLKWKKSKKQVQLTTSQMRSYGFESEVVIVPVENLMTSLLGSAVGNEVVSLLPESDGWMRTIQKILAYSKKHGSGMKLLVSQHSDACGPYIPAYHIEVMYGAGDNWEARVYAQDIVGGQSYTQSFLEGADPVKLMMNVAGQFFGPQVTEADLYIAIDLGRITVKPYRLVLRPHDLSATTSEARWFDVQPVGSFLAPHVILPQDQL